MERWLAEDPLVDEYRRRLRSLPEQCKEHLRLLSIGGKLVCRRHQIDQETDDNVRSIFFRGIITTNLLPGFYQFRNLTVRYLWSEVDGFGRSPSPLSFLRRSANAKVQQLLQDAELSLRYLLRKVLENLGPVESRKRLEGTRTAERSITPELTKRLLVCAESQGGAGLREAMNRILAQIRKESEAKETLWAKVCSLYRAGTGAVDRQMEPPVSELPDFLTFNELVDLLLSCKAEVFTTRAQPGDALPPADRWREYLARIRRLRNQTAHLRNVSFQDLEDLLATARAVRNDFQTQMCVLEGPAMTVPEVTA